MRVLGKMVASFKVVLRSFILSIAKLFCHNKHLLHRIQVEDIAVILIPSLVQKKVVSDIANWGPSD